MIARLNMGGPAHHVSVLTGRLDPSRYQTLLVHGSVGRGEKSLAEVAAREGCSLRFLLSNHTPRKSPFRSSQGTWLR